MLSQVELLHAVIDLFTKARIKTKNGVMFLILMPGAGTQRISDSSANLAAPKENF